MHLRVKILMPFCKVRTYKPYIILDDNLGRDL
jgi:hypothetical protein